MKDIKFLKVVIFLNCILPVVLLSSDAWRGQLGPNPIESYLRTTGVTVLVLLLITLSITPLRRLFGWNGLIRFRRMLGLFAFFYAAVHLVTYSVFDKSLDLTAIVSDIVQRPFIAVGMSALVLMVPLAITSTNGMVKRLGGKNWARLQRLIYPIAVLGVIHFWMIVKSDIFYPTVLGVVLVLLLVIRYIVGRMQKAKVKPTRSASITG
ncbi:MAG: protein-methionine-sulfoxide reductase heme-binding subunit MsrQ [Acidobacteriota bacterium]